MNARRKKEFTEAQVGHHLLEKVPTAKLSESVAGVRRRILGQGRRKAWDSISYIYILDERKHLKGVASIKEVLAAPLTRKMSSFRQRELATVRPHSSVSVAVARAIKHSIKSVPVVDENNVFLGSVGTDVILLALESMHVRDLFFKAGVNPRKRIAEIFDAGFGQLFAWRFPWLFLGLIGGVALTAIMSNFHESLNQVVELAFFVPMIVYMADAIGTQTQTIYIRGIAFGAIDSRKYLWREICIDMAIGVVAAAIMWVVAYALTHSMMLAGIVACAMFLVISTAGSVAVMLAYLFKRFTRDPALGGGPLTTVIQDALTIIIYFSVATIALSIYG